MPAVSDTADETVTVYTVDPVWPLGVNTAWIAEQEVRVQPTDGKIVTVEVFTVVQSIFSDHVMVTLLLLMIPVAPSAGSVVVIAGAVLSTVTVLPPEGVSTMLDESVARL